MPSINISVVAVTPSTATSKAGKPYQLVEVAYKNNSYQGKLESAKINQYSKVFKEVSAFLPGQNYVVEKEKDASGYYQWLSVVQAVPGQVVQPVTTPNVSERSAGSARSNSFETSEERAKKQVMIVKQSSLAQAVALLSVGAKTPPSTQLVLDQAQKFVDWVVEDKPLSMDELTNLPNDLDMQVE